MVARSTLNVSLTPHFRRLVDEKLSSGEYGSASELVREGLRLVEQRDRHIAIEEMRAKIDVGWQQSVRGESRDGEKVFAEQRKKLLKRVRSDKAGKQS